MADEADDAFSVPTNSKLEGHHKGTGGMQNLFLEFAFSLHLLKQKNPNT